MLPQWVRRFAGALFGSDSEPQLLPINVGPQPNLSDHYDALIEGQQARIDRQERRLDEMERKQDTLRDRIDECESERHELRHRVNVLQRTVNSKT